MDNHGDERDRCVDNGGDTGEPTTGPTCRTVRRSLLVLMVEDADPHQADPARGRPCHSPRRALQPWSTAPEGVPMTTLLTKIQHLTRPERGATAVEYGLMVGLIAIVIIVAVALLGTNLRDIFNTSATSI
ncbi:hypothetical protein GCM10009867_21650 [Pedococcus aerophilus]|uniref:Flp family type IVb pilin n=2 Tax=Pedococcus aerophilus TaxID=436356 RepID=A0ABN3UP51_9MICO